MLKVIIYANIIPNSGVGGVEGVVIGLVQALGKLPDEGEEYIIVAHRDHADWLTPYLGPRQRIVVESATRTRGWKKWVRPDLMVGKEIKRFLKRFLDLNATFPTPRISNGFFESLGADVIHFPYQHFEICALPSIFNPHDLQHRHFPNFFSPKDFARREVLYRAGCAYSQVVAVCGQWVKQDVMQNFGTPSGKIAVIPWSPNTQAFANPDESEIASARTAHALPDAFALYPAMTWPHKNHLALIEALHLLRERHGLEIPLICTGTKNSFWPRIERRIRELKMERQVRFLGMVPTADLRAMYRLCRCVVVPSHFEAESGPVCEAWNDDVPVVCANTTSFPDLVKDAALMFDPFSVEDMADKIRRLWESESLRRELREKGRRRLQDFSWEITARGYRALYRRLANQPLGEEDRALLANQ